MDNVISEQSVINTIHKTIYSFFDVVEDDSGEPMNEKDKLLLRVNKAICNEIKELPSTQQECIHCKDCKYWLDIDDGRQKHRMCADVYGNWFCADAERRQDE
jgi:hypothetical protein